MSERGTKHDRDDALAACASVLFREGPPSPDRVGALMRRRDLRSARRLFFGSLLYLPAVLTALVIDRWV